MGNKCDGCKHIENDRFKKPCILCERRGGYEVTDLYEIAGPRVLSAEECIEYDCGKVEYMSQRESFTGGFYHGKKKPDFGDYVSIEQKRHGAPNEHYQHKVIGRLRSNSFVKVPVQCPAKETRQDEIVEVVTCVCCGVSERNILKYRLKDCKPWGNNG